MDVLYLLIPLAMVFVVFVAFALFWAIRSGQYEDMEGPAHRILMDDDDPMIPGNDDRPRQDSNRAGDGPRADTPRADTPRAGSDAARPDPGRPDGPGGGGAPGR